MSVVETKQQSIMLNCCITQTDDQSQEYAYLKGIQHGRGTDIWLNSAINYNLSKQPTERFKKE